MELATFQIGEPIDFDEAVSLVNKDKKRVEVLNNGSKLWIIDFVHFQYGDNYSQKSAIHRKVFSLLVKAKFLVSGWTTDRVEDRDTHRDRDTPQREREREYKNKYKYIEDDVFWDVFCQYLENAQENQETGNRQSQRPCFEGTP
jgi:hypothetical protein